MKLAITHSQINSTPFAFLRGAGYSYIESRRTGQGSYARPLGSSAYPRFHIYVDEFPDKLVFNIHLDQKQASYEGTTAHSGEYDGATVAAEVERIKRLLEPDRGPRSSRPAAPSSPNQDERSSRWSEILRNM